MQALLFAFTRSSRLVPVSRETASFQFQNAFPQRSFRLFPKLQRHLRVLFRTERIPMRLWVQLQLFRQLFAVSRAADDSDGYFVFAGAGALCSSFGVAVLLLLLIAGALHPVAFQALGNGVAAAADCAEKFGGGLTSLLS